ncbi:MULTISPECIES: hypothetical protein [unclassified Streptomyces]|uniref:hypothetical protein n=1 Tax=unclassified Streptomyces TaxID=2593676 RepID=UPI002E129D90|nr:hypothetical protein OIE76_00405 [Streptomyces sp. NBC_01727]
MELLDEQSASAFKGGAPGTVGHFVGYGNHDRLGLVGCPAVPGTAPYDGLLRERQTQAPATGTQNRVMTERMYDTRGWAWQSYSTCYATGLPSAKLGSAAVNTVPTATQNLIDGTGRVTGALSVKFGDEQ